MENLVKLILKASKQGVSLYYTQAFSFEKSFFLHEFLLMKSYHINVVD